VIARPHHPQFEELKALAANHSARLEIASEPAEIAQKIARCHFALTSGNSLSIELACVGVPQLLIVQAEVHWPTAQRLEDEGAAICLGWHENASASTIRNGVHNLLAEPLERQSMARCARQLIDGRGPDRLVTALEVMLHPSRLLEAEFRAAA
jgi:spore coat polysaccharide biosynthesis predicted glycosyltransferase SpsG